MEVKTRKSKEEVILMPRKKGELIKWEPKGIANRGRRKRQDTSSETR